MLAGDLHRLLGILDDAEMAGHRIDAGLLGQLLGFDLVAHGRDGAGRRADEDDARLLQGAGEIAVLRQEAVAGMHRFGAGLLATASRIAVDGEIALRRGRAGR